MIKVLATVLVTGTFLASCAVTCDKALATDQPIDTEMYCYFADKAFSEGARMNQHGSEVRCVRAKDSELSATVPANVLVWQKVE